MSWSTSELRVRLAPLNRLKPSSKIFYRPFQGGTSFVDLLCFCSVLCLLCLYARLFICALWSPAGKGLTSWLSFVVSTVSLSLFHWCPGSGVELDCIDSWSLNPYLLRLIIYGNESHLGHVTRPPHRGSCTQRRRCFRSYRTDRRRRLWQIRGSTMSVSEKLQKRVTKGTPVKRHSSGILLVGR